MRGGDMGEGILATLFKYLLVLVGIVTLIGALIYILIELL